MVEFNFENFGVILPKNKAALGTELRDLLLGRVNKIEKFLENPTQPQAGKIVEDTATILAFCKAHKLKTDENVLVEGINILITHALKKVTQKKTEPKTETEKTKPAAKKTAPKKAKVATKKAKVATKKTEPKAKPTPVVETPKTKPVRASKPEQAAKPIVEFTSPCGGEFDPDPTSSCFMMCKEDTLEDFQACLKNYQEILEASAQHKRDVAAKNRSAGTKKKYDFIGDGVGTTAHMINVMLIEGATLAEIADIIPVKKTRVTGHFSGLRKGNTRRTPKVLVKDKELRWKFEKDSTIPDTYLSL